MSERDPLGAARDFARALAELAPPVPRVELSLAGAPALALARFRLGQVPDHGWSPSLALVGRRAVGKSSLALALAGFASTGGDLAASCAEVPWGGDVLAYDTPGLRAAGRPALRQELADALAPDPPDVMIAVFSVTEVDAGIDDDVADLVALSRAWTPRRGAPPALLAALHRVDELPPFDHEPAPDDPERALAIETATRVLRARLSPLDGRCPIVATSAFPSGGGPAAVGALAVHARARLESRVTSSRARRAVVARCLDALGARERGSPAAGLRRAWDALDDQSKDIALSPRGWGLRSGGRPEPG